MQIWQFASLLQPYLHLRKLSTKKELFQSDIVCICAICIVSNYSLWWPAQLLNKYLFGQKGCAELTCIHVRAGMDGLCNFINLFILLVKWSYCKWGASWKYKSVHNLDVTQPQNLIYYFDMQWWLWNCKWMVLSHISRLGNVEVNK